jgi:hypothetical protein
VSDSPRPPGPRVNEPTGGTPLWRLAPGVTLLLVGLAAATFLLGSLAADLSLWLLGRRATATVVDQWAERVGEREERELTFRYFIRYEFTAPGGQVVTKTSPLSVLEWGALETGGSVPIVYFPLYPAHTRLEEGRFIPILLCSYLPLALVGWAGLWGGWHLIHSVLAEPQEPYPVSR